MLDLEYSCWIFKSPPVGQEGKVEEAKDLFLKKKSKKKFY